MCTHSQLHSGHALLFAFSTVCTHSRLPRTQCARSWLSHRTHTVLLALNLSQSVPTLPAFTQCVYTPGLHTVCTHSRLAHSVHAHTPARTPFPLHAVRAHSGPRTHSRLSPGPARRRAPLAGRVNDSRGSAAHSAYCVRRVDAQQLGTFYDFTGLWGGECQPGPPLGWG